MKRLVRSILVHAPALKEAKAEAKSLILRLARKPFEPEFEILAHLNSAEGECAIDAGANRGQSIEAIRLFQPTLRIQAFEPDADLSARLQKKFSGDQAVVIEPHGLGAQSARVTLFTPVYGDYAFDGLASTDRSEAHSWLNAKTLVGFDPSKLSLREQEIQIEPLDAFGLRPTFLKIDVQGGEEAVLAGGARTIERSKPVLLIETGLNEALVQSIVSLGYRALNFDGGRLVLRAGARRNTVFVHRDAPRGLEAVLPADAA